MYRPNNEIIVIGGRFDRDKILETIKESYGVLEFDNKVITKNKEMHRVGVNKLKNIIKTNTGISRGLITIKLDTLNLTGLEKLNLDMYLNCFLKMNFGITSKLNKEMIDSKLVNNGIVYSNFIVEGYHYLKIEADTINTTKFINRVLKYFKEKEYIFDKELFEIYKKNIIINMIIRNDSIYDIVDPFIDNIVSFNYEGLDKISDLEDCSFNDFKEKITNLDFTNYSITILKNDKRS